ncbi:unnamed protein product [Adineta steineri]|uniref:Uncharacterized protein n=1 Tax=Adineta steineri TaxID=433720 RepID=A0A813VNQ6_9BILA|nr:unnamed protein product [Adineta steineri]CAF3817769.1 unnamed protein product [Adineta steineri]
MPKSHKKNRSTSNASVVPLLDNIFAQIQSSTNPITNTETNKDNSEVSSFDWQCDTSDWSDKKPLDNVSDTFPQTVRSIQRKHDESKAILFPIIKKMNNENKTENQPDVKEENTDRTKTISMNTINLTELTLIVNDLIGGKRDESAYKDFLPILQHFSVHSHRDDHLEETVYHLIQAAVSFIRSNQQRFDPLKLEECYRQRYFLKTNSNQ